MEELLGYVRRGKLDTCLQVLSNYGESEKRRALESVYLTRMFLDQAKKSGQSREAHALLVEADKLNCNMKKGKKKGGKASGVKVVVGDKESLGEKDGNIIRSNKNSSSGAKELAADEGGQEESQAVLAAADEKEKESRGGKGGGKGQVLSYDSRMASSVIGVCARSGDSMLAQQVMQYLSSEKGLQLDIFMYTSAINACAKKGEVNTACRLFRQSEVEDGLQPDAFMYCALMKVFRQAIANSLKRDTSGEDNQSEALLEEALKYVDHMKEEEIVGDTVFYNCLISTCGRARQLEEAEKFFWEMQKLEVQPNSKTYSILIHACLSSKEGDKALSYFRDAREQTGMINAHLGAQAIQAHGMLESEDTEETLKQAVQLYKELDIEGIQMDGVAAASLISLAGDLGYHQKALEILNTQISSSSAYRERLPPEPFAVAAAMCAKQRDIEGAKGILAHIQTHSSLIPNHELGASLIDAFSKEGDLVTSFEVLELLLSRGCSPNSYSFSGLLYACACAGLPVLALRLYELAKRTGAVPNIDCLYGTWCSSVLHSFLKTRREGHIDDETVGVEYIQKITGDIEERLRVLKGGKKPSQGEEQLDGSFGSGSGSMTKDEIVTGIKQMYRDALDKGYKPSVKVLDMMLECLCTDLYLEKIQKVTPDPVFAYEAPITDVSQGAGLFETSAFALFEEAGELGVLPSCVSQSDLEIKIDFRELTPVVSEVCLLVLLRSLKRRWDSSQGKHEFKSILMILPVQKEEAEISRPLVDRKVKSLLRHVGMEYVMIDRGDRYSESDCILLIVRPKTIKACLSGQFDTVHDMYDSISKQSAVRMEYYTHD